MRVRERVTSGQVFVDGLGVGDVGNIVLRDRRQLSTDGILIVVVTMDAKTASLGGARYCIRICVRANRKNC